MFVSAIIAAGGSGQRVGGVSPKQLLHIGGRAMLDRSVSAFVTHPSVDEVVVALPPSLAAAPPDFLQRASKPLRIVAGGDRRRDSVANAFRAVAEAADIVLVHDAARPFVSADLISRTIQAAIESGAVLAALAARDTVKLTRTSDEHLVQETLPRERVFLAQTPQAFRRAVLADALALNLDATDEAALVERTGYPVRVVEGETSNFKITTRDDLSLADSIAERGRDVVPRVGVGYDLHRLVPGRPLILGGVRIEFERGLLGHSDADAVCHAVTDAILGAAGAGDIGMHFPDTDPRWAGASSLDLLAQAVRLVAAAGFTVENVDVVVIAERPKLRPYIEEMRGHVARALGVTPDRVSIKGKTDEATGALGRGEAIAAHAVAMLSRRTG